MSNMFAAKPNYAHLYSRVVANIIDNFLISLMVFFVMVILTFSNFDVFNLESFSKIFVMDINAVIIATDPEVLAGLSFFVIYMTVLYILLSLLYFQLTLVGPRAATYGMRILKIKLVKLSGERIGFNEIFLRNILFLVFKFTYIGVISLFTIPFIKKHQALHDMPFGDIVIDKY